MSLITDYHAKYYAHELSRRHSAADSEKLAGALLDAQVDLNPHQLEAALFAFKSPLSKGAILADEVGLGKTIEAGLVLSQKWAEGKRRILVITPANLRKQWSQELADKFFLPSVILEARSYNQEIKKGNPQPFIQDGLVLCSFQFAAKHSEALLTIRWDLVVIDEAHRLRNVYRNDNKIGKALKTALANVPKVLLTATPLQNSLMELYGLVSLIDDYAFGDVKSFRSQYSRLTGEDSFDELKARLKPVCHRTLRRQVLEYIRYTNRIPITQEFTPSKNELALYDMVSDYLCSPSLYALPNAQRQLMTLILRKLLASSTFAIAGALESLSNKLQKQLKDNEALIDHIEGIEEDFEGYDEYSDEWGEEEQPVPLSADDVEAIQDEINSLQAFKELAVSITENAKGQALLQVLTTGFAKAREIDAQEKAIIFTESRRTQDYLVRLLSDNGYEGKLVLFNGTNADPQSREIYNQWKARHKDSDKVTGSRTADMRAALVDHFRETAQIMIATEAAAEGINLQFCSMVVNYDLPWNPQRVEQRIGRCHRYGQQHDVVVINFLNKENAADQRVYELLAEKFQLFDGVFGASDEVLGAIESGVDFEKRVVNIYQTCRKPEQIALAFDELRAEMDAQITATMEDTRKKLLENFDAEVHDRLRINMEEGKYYLNKYEQMLWKLTRHQLVDYACFDRGELNFFLERRPEQCPQVPDGPYHLGRDFGEAHRYRLGHPLAQYVLHSAAQRELPLSTLVFDYSGWHQKVAALDAYIGQSGQLRVEKISVSGSDAQDHILLIGLLDSGELIEESTLKRLFEFPATVSGVPAETMPQLATYTEQRQQQILEQLALQKAQWFEEEMEKLDNWANDQRKGLKSELKGYDDEIKELKKQARTAANLPDKLAIQKKIKELDRKRDDAWHSYDQASRKVEDRKENLLDQVEAQLEQQVATETLFTMCWRIA